MNDPTLLDSAKLNVYLRQTVKWWPADSVHKYSEEVALRFLPIFLNHCQDLSDCTRRNAFKKFVQLAHDYL